MKENMLLASWNEMYSRVRSHQLDNKGAIYFADVADMHTDLAGKLFDLAYRQGWSDGQESLEEETLKDQL